MCGGVGTRFVAAKEAGAPPRHQRGVLECDYDGTVRTIIFTGRPRLLWEANGEQRHKAELYDHLVEVLEAAANGVVAILRQLEIVMEPLRMRLMVFDGSSLWPRSCCDRSGLREVRVSPFPLPRHS